MSLDSYVIVYSLEMVDGKGIVLPSAYICSKDVQGFPAYIQAAALPTNTESYGIKYHETIHQKLIEICHELQLKEIENALNKNKKKPLKIDALFADAKTQKLIQNQINRRLSNFLNLVKESNSYLCWNLQRKIKANDILLRFFPDLAYPKLFFTKTQTGIKYELKLQVGEEMIIPNMHQIITITDHPGILIINNNIVQLSELNAAKLKPFFQKESIFIPEKMVQDYFTQFILEVMGKVDVEASGFDIIKNQTLTQAALTFVFDLIENKWHVDIKFIYDNFYFMGSDVSRRKTSISFDNLNQIKVNECWRDKNEEERLVNVLLALGFEKHFSNRIYYGKTIYATLERISNYMEQLKVDFLIKFPDIDGKILKFSPLNIIEKFNIINDWFDLHGIVLVGNEEYPIAALFNNIRNDNPFFKLRDGSYVLIPAEIMAKYHQLVSFGIDSEGRWKLAKKHFPILENINALPENSIQVGSNSDSISLPNGLKADLRPYQEQGAMWLIRHRLVGLGACLADDMGLGKTLQTIAALLHAKEHQAIEMSNNNSIQLDLFGEIQVTGRKSLAALVVLPASLVFNWYRELRKFAPSLQVVQYIGTNRKKVEKTLLTFDVILTTYQTIVSDLDWLKQQYFHYIILDESQQIRNKNSKTFQAVHQIRAEHRISLSGTPIENSLADLWAQMEFINPSVLGTYAFFKEHFQIPIEKNRDEQAIISLKNLVDPFILRRTKEQVAPDLPELVETIHYSEMSDAQSKFYEKEKSAARNYLAGLDRNGGQFRFHVMSSLMKLRQIANHPAIADQEYALDSGKFEDIKDQINTIVKSGHKVLIFSSFISHLSLFETWLQSESVRYLLLTGSMNSDQRAKAVTDFQHDATVQVFLISIKAGGTGLNLTAADYVFILDPWWNPFVEMQAVARAHRIGRTNSVFVTRFISKDTIEEKIMRLQEKKRNLSDDIIDINEFKDFSDNDLEKLLD